MVEGTRWECFGIVIGGRISRIECARLKAKPGLWRGRVSRESEAASRVGSELTILMSMLNKFINVFL